MKCYGAAGKKSEEKNKDVLVLSADFLVLLSSQGVKMRESTEKHTGNEKRDISVLSHFQYLSSLLT